MSYYTGVGDYYSGKGDPGLFSFLGKAVGAVTGVASKILPGPLGTVAGVVSRAVGGTRAVPTAPITTYAQRPATTMRTAAAAPVMAGAGAVPVPGIVGTVQRTLPGGATGYAGCGGGYHLNKAYSYAHSAPAGTMCVRNRKLNPANPKALRRAIRRERAFISLARTTLKGTGYTIKKGASYARKTRKRRR